MYLLNTDHIASLQRPSQPERVRLMQRLAQLPPAAIYFCIVSFQEQTVGANAYVNRARTAQEVIRGYGLYGEILDS
jgi:hypothetical protein